MKSSTNPMTRLTTFFHSIRFRLLLWFTGILVLVLVLFSGFLYYNQTRDLAADSLGQLARRSAMLKDALGIPIHQQNTQIAIPGNILQDTDVLVLIDPDGQVIASQGTFPKGDTKQIVLQAFQNQSNYGETPESTVSWIDSKTGYGYVVTPIIGSSALPSLIILGSSLDPDEEMESLVTNLLLGSLLTLIVALGGGYWLADRAMRPVQTITHTARSISETDLNRRINLHSKDELGELASTFDSMLSRLQAAFERQRQFVADASHELRTPLTIVNLETSRALSARRSPQEYERALRVIHSENDFMSHLVNDLLTLARMDNGQIALEKAPLDLSDVVVDAIERLTPLAERNNVSMQTGDLPEARMLGDRHSLLQMVSNLVENAIKYTEGDDKQVTIETGIADGSAWVRVSDNGPGIAPEHMPHLFDRFYRVDEARARVMDEDSEVESPTGSGLGLSIIHWIAQANGGEVHVKSTLGMGSRFDVRFDAL